MRLTASTIIDFEDFENMNELAEHIKCWLDREFIVNDMKQLVDLSGYFYTTTDEEDDFVNNNLTEDRINEITVDDVSIDDIYTGNDVMEIWFSVKF